MAGPAQDVRGGLTAVALPTLTRGALWNALNARHCYATTGERILLELSAGDARMGDEIHVARPPSFEVAIEGTAAIEAVDFFRDDQCLVSVDVMGHAPATSNLLRVAWRGASAPGNWQRARMRWDGELRIAGARILAAHPWAFDTPDEGLREVSPTRVTWRSITAGDWDGLVLELDAIADAELTFVSEPMTLRAGIGELGSGARVVKATSPMRELELRRLPVQEPPLGWRGRFDDPAPLPGAHAYWIRVRQADGAYAWSTPIFATIDPGRGPT